MQFQPLFSTGDIDDPKLPRANTTTVLVMLSAAAMAFSYLWAYAATDALVSAGLLSPWQPGHDPRPGRMLVSFFVLSGAFATIAVAGRWLSRRQLQRIDEMEAE